MIVSAAKRLWSASPNWRPNWPRSGSAWPQSRCLSTTRLCGYGIHCGHAHPSVTGGIRMNGSAILLQRPMGRCQKQIRPTGSLSLTLRYSHEPAPLLHQAIGAAQEAQGQATPRPAEQGRESLSSVGGLRARRRSLRAPDAQGLLRRPDTSLRWRGFVSRSSRASEVTGSRREVDDGELPPRLCAMPHRIDAHRRTKARIFQLTRSKAGR